MQTRIKYLLSASALLVALTVSGCGGGGGGDTVRATTVVKPALPIPTQKSLNFEKHTISVPKDYFDQSNVDKVDIAYSIHRASDLDDYKGILMFNFGGPGGEGIDNLQGLSGFLATEIRNKFDLVTFDPRGTGSSAFSDCEDANNCSHFAKYMGSTTIISDMEEIRKALVDKRSAEIRQDVPFNFLGYSYGTRLGQLYAKFHGEHLRALVLDSPMDPLKTNYSDLSRDDAKSFEEIARFRLNDPNNPDYQVGTYNKLLELKKIVDTDPKSELADKFSKILYLLKMQEYNLWRNRFSHAVVNWIHEPSDINWDKIENIANNIHNSYKIDLLTRSNANSGENIYTSVMCTDQYPKMNAHAVHVLSPDGLYDRTQDANMCINYRYDYEEKRAMMPITQNDIQNKLNSSGNLLQVLIIGGVHDTNTSYEWARSTRRVFGDYGKLAIIDGIATHGFSFTQISAKLDTLTTNYLLYPSQPILDEVDDPDNLIEQKATYSWKDYRISTWSRALGLRGEDSKSELRPWVIEERPY